MRAPTRWLLSLTLILGWSTPGNGQGSDPDEIVVIVHPSVAVQSLTQSDLAAIFTSTRQTWPNGQALTAFSQPPGTPLRTAFDRAVLGMDPEQVGRYWVNQLVRGGPRPPRQIQKPALTVRAVARFTGSVSYTSAAMVDGTVRVVARIRGGRIVAPPQEANRRK